ALLPAPSAARRPPLPREVRRPVDRVLRARPLADAPVSILTGGPEMAPRPPGWLGTPRRRRGAPRLPPGSGRPGDAVAPLDCPRVRDAPATPWRPSIAPGFGTPRRRRGAPRLPPGSGRPGDAVAPLDCPRVRDAPATPWRPSIAPGFGTPRRRRGAPDCLGARDAPVTLWRSSVSRCFNALLFIACPKAQWTAVGGWGREKARWLSPRPLGTSVSSAPGRPDRRAPTTLPGGGGGSSCSSVSAFRGTSCAVTRSPVGLSTISTGWACWPTCWRPARATGPRSAASSAPTA